MVGDQPQPATLIHTHIPDLHIGSQRRNAHRGQIVVERLIPDFIFLTEDELAVVGQHPVIAVFIHITVVSLTGLSAIILHEVVLPQHLTLVAIDGHHIAIAGCDQQFVVPLGKVREVILLIDLVGLVAILDQLVRLFARVIAIESLIVGLDPETFLRVDIEAVDTALNAPFREDGGWVAIHLLGNRIKHTVVHALFQPQLTLAVFPDLVDIVIAQCGRITRIRVIGTEAIAIIAVQAIRGTNPDESARVLEQIVDLRV